jgi:hypothetical protein
MKWIVLTIIVGLVAYTYLTLHYRKAAPAFRPYEDIKSRANTIRLLSAGYQRIPLAALRPADPAPFDPAAGGASAPGGVPAELRATLVDPPPLPAEIVRISAAPAVSALLPYPIQFTCTLADNHRQLVGAELYVKGDALYLIPDFERLNDALLARTRESVVLLTVPAGALKPGRYEATLIGEHASKTWSVQVR